MKKTHKNIVISYNFCNFAVSNLFYMRKICLIPLFLLAFTAYICAQSNYFEYLTTKDGLSDCSVNGFYEDEHARMWIATRNGLNCYDGQSFRVWGVADGIQDTYVRQVAGDRKGHILINTRVGASLIDLYTEKIEELPLQKPSAIAGNAHGLWVAVGDTLYQIYTTPTFQLKPVLHAPSISTIAPVDSQTIWVADKNGVQLFHNGHATGIEFTEIQQVVQFMIDSHHNLWACTRSDGLYLISSQHLLTHYTCDPNNPSSLTDNDVRCITEDALGNYWIGLYGGLCHLNLQSGQIQRYEYDPRAEHALSTFSVWALATDQQGTIWIGTFFGGIDLINPQHSIYTYYGAYGKAGQHLSNPIVTSSCMDNQGNLWIGTNGGGVNYLNPTTQHIDHIRLDKQDPQRAVKSLFLDEKRHQLWIGTHRGGLKRLDTRSLALNKYPLPESNIRKLSGTQDSLLVMTQQNIYLVSTQSLQYQPLIPPHKMPHIGGELSDMTCINDQIWFAYTNHLYCYSQSLEEVQSFHFDANITVLQTSQNNTLLIGTDTRGVWQLTDSGFIELRAINQALPSPYVQSIVSRNNAIVVATTIGVNTYDDKWQLMSSLTNTNGFPLEMLVEHSGCVYGENVLIGGVNGMVLFPLHNTSHKIIPAALQLSSITIDNETPELPCALPWLETIDIHPNNHNLTITATTSGIVTRHTSYLRYRLSNYDHDWITASNTATISYTNLPKGKYTLEIECVGTTLHRTLLIHVFPHWYDSWWAWVIYFIAGIAALIVALIYFEQYIVERTRKQINERNQQDLQKATAIVLNHLADDTFNVQQFAREMCISRTGLYTKLQEITGQTPNDFILSARMREAASLLRTESAMSIVEISERVGFNSSSYFIKCFHRFYGKSPSAWRKELS